MTYLLENINSTIAKIDECLTAPIDPMRVRRLLRDVERLAVELAAPSQTVTSQAEADAVFEAAQAGLPEIPFGPAFIDAYRKHYIAWGQQCFAAGAQAAPQASAEAVQLLAGDHTGMRVDYSGLLMQAANALVAGQAERGLAEMLRQLQGHLTEIGLRWYAGDTGVVDEFCQLYAIADESRTALKSAPTAQAPVSDGKTRVVGEHLSGGCLNWDDGEDSAKGAGDEREPSPTAGMNIAQRILHVGGRNNAQGYVEFGSIQAVEALVRQVLRDLDWTCQDDDGAFQARYRIAGGEWSSWGHVACGVKGHEQQLRYLPDGRQQRGGDVKPVAPDDETITESWISASDVDGIAYDGPSFERGYRAGEVSERDRAALAAQPDVSDQDRQDMETGRRWRADSSLEAWFPLTAEELESTKRMFHAAISDLAAISERLGVDPDDGGAEPILSAIDELTAHKPDGAEPSDEDAAKFADQHGMYYDQDASIAGAHARALLSRYGRPAGDAEYRQAAEVCAELYQVIGSLASDLGVFDHPQVIKALDNAADHSMVHDDVLPFPSFERLPAGDAQKADDARDAAFEAVRQRLCKLQRYSFIIGPHGGVRRVKDRVGNWIEFDAAHALFDPVEVDAAIAQQGKGE